MNFYIKGKADYSKYYRDTKSGHLSVWAKGYNEEDYYKISTEIKHETNIKRLFLKERKATKNGLEAYQIPIDNNEELTLYFKVNGKLGDFINIGVLLFDSNNVCGTYLEEFKSQISGFLTFFSQFYI